MVLEDVGGLDSSRSYSNVIHTKAGMEKIRSGGIRANDKLFEICFGRANIEKATDRRDKIFALLGLMGDCMNRYLQPDYSKPVGQVRICQFLAFTVVNRRNRCMPMRLITSCDSLNH
jgi:hypothetical protein